MILEPGQTVGTDIIQLTDFSSEIDFEVTYGAPCRKIVIKTAGTGTLVLETYGVNAAQSRTITGVWDRFEFSCAIRKIKVGTNVTALWAIL